jgi:hypothetical protein
MVLLILLKLNLTYMALMIIRLSLYHICLLVNNIQRVGCYLWLCYIVFMKPEGLPLAPQPLPVYISRRNTFKTIRFNYCLRKGKVLNLFQKLNDDLPLFAISSLFLIRSASIPFLIDSTDRR